MPCQAEWGHLFVHVCQKDWLTGQSQQKCHTVLLEIYFNLFLWFPLVVCRREELLNIQEIHSSWCMFLFLSHNRHKRHSAWSCDDLRPNSDTPDEWNRAYVSKFTAHHSQEYIYFIFCWFLTFIYKRGIIGHQDILISCFLGYYSFLCSHLWCIHKKQSLERQDIHYSGLFCHFISTTCWQAHCWRSTDGVPVCLHWGHHALLPGISMCFLLFSTFYFEGGSYEHEEFVDPLVRGSLTSTTEQPNNSALTSARTLQSLTWNVSMFCIFYCAYKEHQKIESSWFSLSCIWRCLNVSSPCEGPVGALVHLCQQGCGTSFSGIFLYFGWIFIFYLCVRKSWTSGHALQK